MNRPCSLHLKTNGSLLLPLLLLPFLPSALTDSDCTLLLVQHQLLIFSPFFFSPTPLFPHLFAAPSRKKKVGIETI